jgi:hypothetical protein
MSDHQARFDALIEKTREEYGDAAAESARRIADATLNLNSQSGSDLSFLGSSANRVVMMESSQAACEAFC